MRTWLLLMCVVVWSTPSRICWLPILMVGGLLRALVLTAGSIVRRLLGCSISRIWRRISKPGLLTRRVMVWCLRMGWRWSILCFRLLRNISL